MVDIKQVQVRISKCLHDEIIYAMDNLQEKEKKKVRKKKEYITMLMASDKLGKYLNKIRTNKKYKTNK